MFLIKPISNKKLLKRLKTVQVDQPIYMAQYSNLKENLPTKNFEFITKKVTVTPSITDKWKGCAISLTAKSPVWSKMANKDVVLSGTIYVNEKKINQDFIWYDNTSSDILNLLGFELYNDVLSIIFLESKGCGTNDLEEILKNAA